MSTSASLDLYWIPLGAGARVVRCSGWVYERVVARRRRRTPCDLYHAALIADQGGERTIVEMAPIPDAFGPERRGVVAEGPVGLAMLRRLRVFRYEIRRWPDGVVPDLGFAVGSPIPLTSDRRRWRRRSRPSPTYPHRCGVATPSASATCGTPTRWCRGS